MKFQLNKSLNGPIIWAFHMFYLQKYNYLRRRFQDTQTSQLSHRPRLFPTEWSNCKLTYKRVEHRGIHYVYCFYYEVSNNPLERLVSIERFLRPS